MGNVGKRRQDGQSPTNTLTRNNVFITICAIDENCTCTMAALYAPTRDHLRVLYHFIVYYTASLHVCFAKEGNFHLIYSNRQTHLAELLLHHLCYSQFLLLNTRREPSSPLRQYR